MRTVKKCCNDQIQLYEYCVSKCTEDQCPNIQCLSGTDKCICKPGYTGYLCKQRCGVGYWGSNCEETCHKACPYCDHRNGCCKTTSAIKGHTTVVTGLTFCAQDSASRPTSRTNIGTEYKRGDEIGDGSRLKEWFIVRGSPELAVTEVENQTSTTTMVETRKLVTENRSATEELQADTTEETALPSSSLPKRRQNGGTYVQTVEVMTVYKYDELVKKLIWISAMTVVAIAVVFIIMFVVFFNCYSVSKIPNRTKSRQRHTSTTNKMHETCMTQNLSHIPPDRYTKNPGLRSSINNDLPLHPEIFCPVFSAPHYINAGPALYDSPQPLYEILC